MVKYPIAAALLPNETDTTLHGAWLNAAAQDGQDTSQDANNMTAFGAPILGDGADVDGTNDYLRAGVAGFRSSDTLGSITAWIYIDDLRVGDRGWVFSVNDEGSTSRYLRFGIANGYVEVSHRNADTASRVRGNTALSTGQWYHIGLTSNGTTWTLWLNGQSDGAVLVADGNDGDWLSDITGADNIIIGGQYTTGGGFDDQFNGRIKDVRYYSEEKGADWWAIECNMAAPESDLVLAIGPDGKDYSVYETDMTPQADAIVGSRIELDGTGDYLLNSTANWRSSDTAGTIIAWINPTNDPGTIIASSDQATLTSYVQLYVDASTRLIYGQRNNNDTLTEIRYDTPLALNKWTQVAVTSDGSAYAMYVDGVAVSFSVQGGSDNGDWLGDTTLRDNITIGGQLRTSLGTAWTGSIGEVRVYNTAKSAGYIKAHYLATRGQY